MSYLDECYARELDAYIDAGQGRLIHRTALVNIQPMRSGALARHAPPQPAADIGEGVVIGPHAHIYAGSRIGPRTMLADLSYVREGAEIGADCVIGHGAQVPYDTRIGNRVRLIDFAHVSGCSVIEDDAFIGQGALFANDRRPDNYRWREGAYLGPHIGKGALIGANAYVGPGLSVGAGAVVAAGAIVVKNVAAGQTVKGDRAR